VPKGNIGNKGVLPAQYTNGKECKSANSRRAVEALEEGRGEDEKQEPLAEKGFPPETIHLAFGSR
jgi:hypothetical protein